MSASERQSYPSTFGLDGRKALITGASRGIGREVAIGLAQAGAEVYLTGRDIDALNESARQMPPEARWHVSPMDVTEEQSVKDTVAAARGDMGGLDILVNNAGSTIEKFAVDLSTDEWDTVMNVNLRGAFMCSREAGRHFVEQGAGKVVNIGSVLGSVALPAGSAYAASKGGLLQLTRALALEWAPAGVNVNVVAPGFVESDLTESLWDDERKREWIVSQTPLGRWGKAADVVGAAIFLSSAASDFVTGQALYVDGGWLAT